MTFFQIARKPSAFLPLGMSIAALAIVSFHMMIYGVEREIDEGSAAHIFQVLMAAQVPIVIYFAIKFVPRHSTQAVKVLVLQGLALLAAVLPVYFLNL